MDEKDLAHNDYFSDKYRFADACNGILFQGREVIRPEELEEAEPDIVYMSEDGRHKVIPDKVRIWNGICLGILALENQTNVDYHMVFRTMKAEALSYEKQWNEREAQYQRDGIIGAQTKLCWHSIGKGVRFAPVIVIVIYLGTDKAWDGAVCLYDMLNVCEDLKPYITNYRMNLFDYHEYEDFSFFKTENRELFEVLSCARSEARTKELLYSNEDRYRRLPGGVAETIFDIAGISRKLLKKIFDNGKEYVDMCKAWDDHMETGRREGKLEGKLEGRLEGKLERQVEDIKNLMESLKVSAQQAMDYLKVSETDREQCLALLR